MKNKLFLIAGVCFYAASIVFFLTLTENKVIFMSAFATIGTAFIVLYNTRKKS